MMTMFDDGSMLMCVHAPMTMMVVTTESCTKDKRQEVEQEAYSQVHH